MGHIKANCPRQARPQYPLSSCNNNIQLTVCGSMLDNSVVCGNALGKSAVCEKVLDSSYNNMSAFCGSDDSSPGHLVSVNSSSGVKESPEVRSSISVDSVKVACPWLRLATQLLIVSAPYPMLSQRMAHLVNPCTLRTHLIMLYCLIL